MSPMLSFRLYTCKPSGLYLSVHICNLGYITSLGPFLKTHTHKITVPLIIGTFHPNETQQS